MTKIIDYYLSLNSPWTYMGGPRLAEMAKRHGAEVRVKPVSLGEIFPKTGGLPLPKRAPERQAYRLVELQRWSRFLDLPLNPHPAFFPAAEALAAGCVIAAGQSGGDALGLSQAILRAVWAEEKNIADEATLAELVQASGHDPKELLAQAREPGIAETYAAHTQEALAHGVFGAPSYVYRDELFWGQDRLDFLDRALAE
jgi:2-hydroxychromene-2-carboxylate isomerase